MVTYNPINDSNAMQTLTCEPHAVLVLVPQTHPGYGPLSVFASQPGHVYCLQRVSLITRESPAPVCQLAGDVPVLLAAAELDVVVVLLTKGDHVYILVSVLVIWLIGCCVVTN